MIILDHALLARANKYRYIVLCLIGLFIVQAIISTAFAKDLGIIAHVYPIAEQNLLTVIRQRMQSLKNSGELEGLQQQWIEQSQQLARRLARVAGISLASETKRWLFDPSITLARDIRDTQGHVIAHKGAVNPLDAVSLSQPLLFFDGDDVDQQAWVKAYIEQTPSTLILIGGDVFDNENYFGQTVYFDQWGRLSMHFNIKQMPATVEQQALALAITEWVL